MSSPLLERMRKASVEAKRAGRTAEVAMLADKIEAERERINKLAARGLNHRGQPMSPNDKLLAAIFGAA